MTINVTVLLGTRLNSPLAEKGWFGAELHLKYLLRLSDCVLGMGVCLCISLPFCRVWWAGAAPADSHQPHQLPEADARYFTHLLCGNKLI